MNARKLIDKLVAHYGSPSAVNQAARPLWLTADNQRIMMKVDALWKLYHQLPEAAK